MIDCKTNLLYLSDLLPKRFPIFYYEFKKQLEIEGVRVKLLPQTKDIWAVDYMPVQLNDGSFIQFRYKPDYLLNDKKSAATITDVNHVCQLMGISPKQSNLVIDGGNIIRSSKRFIMTDKICKENPTRTPYQIRNELETVFEKQLIIIPTEPDDDIGHADGMVRLFDDDTVLLNDYSRESDSYYCELERELKYAGLEIIKIPYNPYTRRGHYDATGLYINYLQMEGLIFLPIFRIKEDEVALKLFEEIFLGFKIIPVEASQLAKDGGVLNCISWKIKK